MKAYAPGLVTLAEKGVQNGITVTSINLDLTSRKQRQYRLLVKPNPFNARILFQPYLSFVSSCKKVAGISSLDDEAEVIGTFMDDFVVKVYLPQLEEKVDVILQQAVNCEHLIVHEPLQPADQNLSFSSQRFLTGYLLGHLELPSDCQGRWKLEALRSDR